VASVRGHGLAAVTGCGHSGIINVLVRAHCTGRRADHALAARFPAAFISNGIGTQFEFAAADA
jgi:metal-dependent hydrolase (beta-lactamase superfamily II)